GCDPGRAAVTTVEAEVAGAVALAPGTLPEPPESGVNAGLLAAAAGSGFRLTLATAGRPDGSAAVYRWRARLQCTGPGVPPDPVEQIDVYSPWSELRVIRPRPAPGASPPASPSPAPPPASPPAAGAPKPRVSPPVGPTRARITRFIGWAPRSRPLPVPFTARRVPRPLTPPGGTIRNCARGPRGLLLVFRHAGIPPGSPITWAWTVNRRPLAAGAGTIGGHTLFQLWVGFRDRPAPNGVYTVSIRLGGRLFGAASVRRAC
ncbi:MAG: hypothetical protein AB1416_09475, partial [Actinomycetota bacterium]